MTPQQLLLLIGTVALALWVLWRNLARAVIALKPTSVGLELDAPGDAVVVPGLLEPLDGELLRLGFVRLGTHFERPKLQKPREHLDYLHPADQLFASCFVHDDRGRVDLLTPAGDDGFVLTSSYRRPARDEAARYSSGGMEEATVERMVRAHQRRVPVVGSARGPFTHAGLISALQQWYAGPGGRELRFQNAPALLWTAFSLGMVAAAFLALMRTTR